MRHSSSGEQKLETSLTFKAVHHLLHQFGFARVCCSAATKHEETLEYYVHIARQQSFITGFHIMLIGNSHSLIGNSRSLIGNSHTWIGNSLMLVGNSHTLVGNSHTLVGNAHTELIRLVLK